MDISTYFLAGLGVLFLVIIIVYILGYNRLHKFRNASDAELGQIRVAMKKRLDMIEQLLGAVKGYTQFERDVFEKVAELRSKILTAGPSDLEKIESESRSLFGSIRAVAEAYPDLKASTTVNKLMDAIISVEDEIARQRYTYNNVVQELNTMIDTIPTNFIAVTINMKKMDYLRFEGGLEKAPEIKGIGPS
ncbi:LemA family protein [Candidatus Bathyarchaeota archaeon]|nr:LemA family protein [Candidatus Bathyarchaeota archaeon]